MRRTRQNLNYPVVTRDAIEHRAREIEVTLHLARYHSRGKKLLDAVIARLPEPGSERMSNVAHRAAVGELTTLAQRGVRTFGPGEGPRPR